MEENLVLLRPYFCMVVIYWSTVIVSFWWGLWSFLPRCFDAFTSPLCPCKHQSLCVALSLQYFVLFCNYPLIIRALFIRWIFSIFWDTSLYISFRFLLAFWKENIISLVISFNYEHFVIFWLQFIIADYFCFLDIMDIIKIPLIRGLFYLFFSFPPIPWIMFPLKSVVLIIHFHPLFLC